MNHTEDIFGNELTELVIRFDNKSSQLINKKNKDFSFDEIKEKLTQKEEQDCYFQNFGDNKHKITIPLTSQELHIELIVLWEAKTFNYKIAKESKQNLVLNKNIVLPKPPYVHQKCVIKFISEEEACRTEHDLEELFNKVCELEITTNIDKENKIWYKYINATKKVIEQQQQPFSIKNYHSIKPIDGNIKNAKSFSFKVDLDIEINKEYKEIEKKLISLDVKQPKFDQEGNIFLTIDDISNALDIVLEKEFKDVIIRQDAIGCIIKIVVLNELEAILKDNNMVGLNVTQKGNEIHIINLRNSMHKLENICHNNNYKILRYNGKFKVINHGKDITQNEAINKKHNIYFEDNENGHIFPKPINNEFFLSKENSIDLICFRQSLENIYGKENVSFSIDCILTQKNKENKSINKNIKRFLYSLDFNVDFRERSNSIFFEFQNKEELEKKIAQLKKQHYFNLNYTPNGFKYKVKTNLVPHASHLESIWNRIESLNNVNFEIIEPKQDEHNEWYIPNTKYPKKLSIGNLNLGKSTIHTLSFELNTFNQEDRNAIKKLQTLTTNRNLPIEKVYPNLTGDAAKIRWLQQAVNKLTNPTDKPNGKPINPKFKDFIFDSSKAEPIYDSNKITQGSVFWQDVENNSLSKTLNDSQIKAILAAIYSTDLCLLQGPPGTGKTTVIAEIIWQHIRKSSTNKCKILLTSETNLAVDNALEKLIDENRTIVKPLRFGRSVKLEEEGKKYSIERIQKWADEPDNTPNKNVHQQLEIDNMEGDTAEDLSNNAVQEWMLSIGNRAQKTANAKYAKVIQDWHTDLALPTQAVRDLFKDKYLKYANVIGSTCSSCGSPKFKEAYNNIFQSNIMSFDVVIMDEASKATPPEMILPLCFGKKSIIIGDHKQLPPMINEREFKEILEEEAGGKQLVNEIEHDYLKNSQFKRLIINSKTSPTIISTFDTQYRMHSKIGALIQQFYPELENGLVCGIKEEEDLKDLNNKASRYHGFSHHGFIKPNDHVIWVDVPEPEEKDGTSRVNKKEVETIKQVLNYLKNSKGFEEFQNHWEKEKDLNKRLQEQEIGIISFYGKQVRALNEVKKYAQKDLNMSIRLKTVDKFQGMERNIIIVSTVRSDKIIDFKTKQPVNNTRGKEGRYYSPWGFADSPERLNVALSRARRLLIIVGNKQHFENFKNKQGIPIYKKVIQKIPSENIIDYTTLNKYK